MLGAAASAAASAATAAVTKLASASSLPFETGDEVTSFTGKTPWKLHNGKKVMPDGVTADVSIFLYDLKTSRGPAELAIVRNALRRLRTMKHPYMLRCI